MSRDLDGTLEEFPHREVAMAAYRKIWLTYRTLDQDSAAAAQLEKQMDALQSRICYGPGPLWQSFADFLPGFREYWKSFEKEAYQMLYDLEKRLKR